MFRTSEIAAKSLKAMHRSVLCAAGLNSSKHFSREPTFRIVVNESKNSPVQQRRAFNFPASDAELWFTEKLWPEFSEDDLDEALKWFAGRERRFGKTSEQIRNGA